MPALGRRSALHAPARRFGTSALVSRQAPFVRTFGCDDGVRARVRFTTLRTDREYVHESTETRGPERLEGSTGRGQYGVRRRGLPCGVVRIPRAPLKAVRRRPCVLDNGNRHPIRVGLGHADWVGCYRLPGLDRAVARGEGTRRPSYQRHEQRLADSGRCGRFAPLPFGTCLRAGAGSLTLTGFLAAARRQPLLVI
jgi:hypothetical protein